MSLATESRPASSLPHPQWRDQPALLRRLFKDPVPVLDELADRYGPIFGLGGGPVRLAVVGDPSALRELFALPSDVFRWGHRFNVLGFVVGNESMIVSDGADHKRRRSSVQAAFSRRRLNGWIPMIVDRTDASLDRLTASLADAVEQVDLYTFGRSLVLEIAIRSLFGERLADRADEIGALFQRPQDYLESPALRQFPHPFPGTRRSRVRADRQAIDTIIDAEIAHLRAHPSDDPLDVLASLVADGTLTDREIRDQVATLMGAGYDTTSASLAWMIWSISLSPGLWSRLRAEADQTLGPSNVRSNHDEHSLAQLDLAERTMRETLRLHPAGVVGPRQAAIEVIVGGHRIPKGSLILWSAHLAGRDPTAWSDPLRFDPDRFADTTAESRALADIAWVPFGGGRRNCIGFALAQTELTLIIARLAQRLDIAAITHELPHPVGMVVNRPTGGALMHVSLRDHRGSRDHPPRS